MKKNYSQIYFFSENTPFQLKGKKKIKKWISDVVLQQKHVVGNITFVFCSDEYLLKLNQLYLNHDTFTDIISFDYSELIGANKKLIGANKKLINGEIYISITRVKENATLNKQTFTQELHRVIIHGILHFCGFKDKRQEEKKLMRKMEDESLAIIFPESTILRKG
ncbi:MAG: rRNA maturation RNase YbeY [Bacteroidota bacterium]